MADDIRTRISLEENVTERLRSIQSGLRQTATMAAKVSFQGLVKGFDALAKTATVATTAAVGALGGLATKAVEIGKEYESAMSQVAATMLIDKTTEQGRKDFATLEAAAQKMGAETAFSAKEAAEGLNYLALAGYNAEQAAKALPTVLKLAGAGAMDLASASDMITDSMSALNIEATEENLTRFADELAKTASSANASVSQMGQAILTVGGTASQLAGGTVELNTALGLLANTGLKGAEGGTHLRNIILALQNATGKSLQTINKLTNGVYDSQGKMRSLGDIFQEMEQSMKSMGYTSKQVDETVSQLFNVTDLTAVRSLLAQSGEFANDAGDEITTLYEKIANSSGSAADMYTTQLDNLDGQLARLSSAASALGIVFTKAYKNR